MCLWEEKARGILERYFPSFSLRTVVDKGVGLRVGLQNLSSPKPAASGNHGFDYNLRLF